MKLQTVFSRLCRKFLPNGTKAYLEVTDLLSKDYYGLCQQQGDGSWVVTLDSDLEYGVALHFLIHEFAHMMAPQSKHEPHGPEWGASLSRVYQFLFDHNRGKKPGVKL